ncbi:hypothetical protein N658DRAFT_488423 [Parathielavia hyrcaniae]|uniref:Golgi apparatus membrane protein TVP38 n=1 Tax=Parathielavia hyrcaniae TaxID=113614 RepID=A0AAN6SZH5_9PEZI|nr:hypothetical protein N658DRAFT_488423 [Parathielavia hyrcaniae]
MMEHTAIELMPVRQSRRTADIETDYRPINWKRLVLAPKYLAFWIITTIVLILTIVIAVRHDEVVLNLQPWAEKVRDLPAGWLIPIVILIIISFPPLFGHEIVALLCGVVYGLWIGFGIVAAGTFLGELGTWFAFRYLFRRKAEKLERTNLNYGALARLTRDGGFWIVLLIRFSAIPSHFSTAVFSTCDVNFWAFAFATFLTLPKQIFLVYLGVLLLQEEPDHSAKNVVFAGVCVMTIIMSVYILYKMRRIKVVLLAEQAERRRAAQEGVFVLTTTDDDEGPESSPERGGVQNVRTCEAVAQEEADIGVVKMTSSKGPLASEHPSPYRSHVEYHGAASGQIDSGAVRGRTWQL